MAVVTGWANIPTTSARCAHEDQHQHTQKSARNEITNRAGTQGEEGTRTTEHGIWYMEHEIRDTELGTRKTEHGTRAEGGGVKRRNGGRDGGRKEERKEKCGVRDALER